MKAYFHDMACHAGRGRCDCYAVLRLTIVKRQLLQTRSQLLPNSKYAAMMANKVLQEKAETQEGKKRGAQSGPKGIKMYAEDTRMQAADPGGGCGAARAHGRGGGRACGCG